MANVLYKKGAEKILSGNINLSSDTIKATLVTSAYTADLNADEFFSSVSGAYGTPVTLASKTFTNGTFDAADWSLGTVNNSTTYTQIVVWKDTGNNATSPLIARIDTAGGLPVTLNGGTYSVPWNASGIFSIA